MVLLIAYTLFVLNFSQQEGLMDNTANLKIKVTDIPSDKGNIILMLYNSKESYLKSTCHPVVIKPAKKGEMEFVFKGLEYSYYAVMAHHDENGNGDMDTYFFGLPKEHYGFSNDARSVYGPPSFADSKILVDAKEVVITFKLQ